MYKTSALTASGRAKDRFHFTYATDAWEATSGSGTELGYGVTWSRSVETAVPRVWMVAMVAPGSPAALAGMRRGDELSSVGGTALGDNTPQGVATLNAGLFPAVAGERHRLVLARAGAALTVNLTAAQVAAPPVQNVKTIDTPSGKVGYLQFDDHNQLSEGELAKAITTLKSADVADLVLDMRYNGGGYLAVASELAYMIAGPSQTDGKIFERLRYNDKTAPQAPTCSGHRGRLQVVAAGRRRGAAVSGLEAGDDPDHAGHLFGQRIGDQQPARHRRRSQSDRRRNLRQAVRVRAGG